MSPLAALATLEYILKVTNILKFINAAYSWHKIWFENVLKFYLSVTLLPSNNGTNC